RRFVEHFAESRDLRTQVAWVIADEETTVMCDICVLDLAYAVVIEILDHVVAKKTATGNDAIPNGCLLQGTHHFFTINVDLGVKNHREKVMSALKKATIGNRIIT